MTELNVLGESLELETARKIFWLLLHDHIFLGNYNSETKAWDGDAAYPVINCNDLFVPGADAEPLKLEDLDAYIAVVKRWPEAGSYAWCAVKRAANPWRPLDDSAWCKEFAEAVETIPVMLKEQEASRWRPL